VILLAVVGLGLTIAGRGHRPGTERLPLLFYAAATLLMWVLALGPGGEGDDPASPFYPYSWLLSLPGFDGLRVPARFAMLATLCLAVVAGLTIERLSALAPRWQIVVGAVAIAGFVADGMTHPMPMVTPPGRIILPGPAEGALLELPADDPFLNIAAMYRGMFHRRPLVNGYSGHNPPHFQVLSLSLDRGDTSPLFFLARQRPLVIIVNDALDVKRGFRELIGSVPGIEKHGVSTAGSVFMLPAQAQGREPPRSGPVIPTTVESPGNYRLEFDVGTPQTITALEFPLRRRYDDLAVRLQIETSEDGRTWTEAWAGWTGALAVEATLSDPVRAPIRIALPAPRARYLRIYPASAWMAAETTVHGI
jgi:hypothetical protein